MSFFLSALIVLGTVLLMELGAYATHRWIMHGSLGWNWHKSHHEEREGVFEKNDLYAVFFAGVAIALFVAGSYVPYLTAVAIGVTAYGVLYSIFHDGLVHHRWLFRKAPRSGYMKRLYQAHKLHHAVEGKDGAVSFGFLYAPPVPELKKRLRENDAQRPRAPSKTLH